MENFKSKVSPYIELLKIWVDQTLAANYRKKNNKSITAIYNLTQVKFEINLHDFDLFFGRIYDITQHGC